MSLVISAHRQTQVYLLRCHLHVKHLVLCVNHGFFIFGGWTLRFDSTVSEGKNLMHLHVWRCIWETLILNLLWGACTNTCVLISDSELTTEDERQNNRSSSVSLQVDCISIKACSVNVLSELCGWLCRCVRSVIHSQYCCLLTENSATFGYVSTCDSHSTREHGRSWFRYLCWSRWAAHGRAQILRSWILIHV